jgi:hypothetical protein
MSQETLDRLLKPTTVVQKPRNDSTEIAGKIQQLEDHFNSHGFSLSTKEGSSEKAVLSEREMMFLVSLKKDSHSKLIGSRQRL